MTEANEQLQTASPLAATEAVSETQLSSLAGVADAMPGQAAYVYGEVKRYLGKRVIDAGAGVGLYSEIMVADGKEVVAVEGDGLVLNELRSRLEKLGAEVYGCDMAAAQGLTAFPPADSAICINVLEHIGDDTQALINLRQRLKPGGRLVLLVPAHPWLYNSMDKAVGHFRRYTRRSLLEVLARSGWSTEKVTYFNSLSIPAWFLAGHVMHKEVAGDSLWRLGSVLLPTMNWIDKHIVRGLFGISLIVVARNPAPARSGGATSEGER